MGGRRKRDGRGLEGEGEKKNWFQDWARTRLVPEGGSIFFLGNRGGVPVK